MGPLLLFPIELLLAALLVAGAWNTRYRRSALWAALALAGHAAALQIVEAGPVVAYHHLRIEAVWSDLPHLTLGVLLLAQAGLTLWGLWRVRQPLLAWRARHLAGWRLPALVGVMMLLSAVPTRQTVEYGIELVWASLLQWVSIGSVVLAAWHLPEGSRIGLRVTSLTRRGLLALAAGVFLATSLLSLSVYERHPHIPDEVGFLMHAGFLANGKLSDQEPPVGGGFEIDLMTYDDGLVYSPFPPGWPALLSVGVAAGEPWLVNPILAALNVVLVFLLVSRLIDRETASLVTILYAVAPWNLFLAMSFMSHTFAMTCGLTAALGIILARERQGILPVVLAGAAVGVLTLIRPLDGVIIGLLLGLWSLGLGGGRLRLIQVAAFAIATLLVTAINFGYNDLLTGNPALFPVNEYFDKYYGAGVNNFGFGANRGVGWTGLDPFPGHDARDVVINSALNLAAINFDFLGWATGAAVLPLLLLIWGGLRRAERLMVGVILAIAAAHAFYWFSGGPDFGARYWYFMVLPLTVLTVRGAQELMARIPDGRDRVLGGVMLLVLGGTLVFVPWRATNKYYQYRGMEPGIRRLAHSSSMRNALVLVQGRRHPDYASAIVYNPIPLQDSAPLFAWDQSPAVRDSLISAFPTRDIWLVQGPTITGNGYQVVRGPCRASRDSGTGWQLACPGDLP